MRKVFYNITVTSLSVAIALLVGTVELLQVLASQLHLQSGFFSFLDTLNFQTLGYVIVGLFVVAWAASVAVWKGRHIEERWGGSLVPKEDAPESGPDGSGRPAERSPDQAAERVP